MVEILYEDNHLLVVVKPQNLPTQSDVSGDECLVDICKKYIKEKKGKTEGEVYLGLIHRLDRPTGGVMVLAKTSKCASRLSEAFRERKVKKAYLLVTKKVIASRRGTLVDYLKKDTTNNIVRIAPLSEQGAKKAVLNYEILAKTDEYSLAKVELETGRSHQIRIQFANMKAPIYGDVKYGVKANDTRNLALYSYMLSFEHPVKNEMMTFISYPPETEAPWTEFNIRKELNI